MKNVILAKAAYAGGKKGVAILFIALILASWLVMDVRALEMDLEQAEAFGVAEIENSLPDEARDILGDITVMDSISYESFFTKLGAAAREILTRVVRKGLRSSALLLMAAVLCSLAGAVCSVDIPDFIPLCGTAAVAAVAVGDVRAFIGMGADTLYRLSEYSKVLLPSIASAAAASGAYTSATMKYTATALFIDILLTATVNILMPMVYAYIAVIIANAAFGGEALDAVSKLLKWLCTSMLTILMLIFTGYLSISGIISGTADATVTRVAKNAISTALPVVGGIVSGAAETILAGAGILRNAIGVFGMLSVAAVCLAPFLSIGSQYLLYKLTAGIAAALADRRLGGLISGIGSAFGIVLGLVGSGAFMMFISLVSSMRAVTGT